MPEKHTVRRATGLTGLEHVEKGVLVAYRDDRLEETVSLRVREHIVTCLVCRQEYCRIAHLA